MRRVTIIVALTLALPATTILRSGCTARRSAASPRERYPPAAAEVRVELAFAPAARPRRRRR